MATTYARAMASYGVLQAVQGYWYDGPKGIIGFDPKIEKNDIIGFFNAAEGWGKYLTNPEKWKTDQ